ncbi:sulfotransferase [Actinopolymorpha sp. B17G11]|uniref:sulfotransferase family protein n=1 Tax=unclassified Actinopolymorpha TaxID=2627063 RepID=UPI0032D967E8
MNLLEISRTERATSPVFIVGEARSGTTILYRMLQKHPAFRPRSENLWESKIMVHLDSHASFGPREPPTMYGHMAHDDDRYQAFLASIAPLRPVLAAGAAALRRVPTRHRSRIWTASGHPLVVRSYFHHARAARGARRVLEKTPAHIKYVHRLLRCYPNARLIYIHRHPVDVYTSYVRRANVDPAAARWARMSPEAFAQRWARNSTLALAAAESVSRSFLMHSYETFTADPQAAGRQICEFVGEAFDPEIIRERNPNPTRRTADPHLFGELTTKTKNWHDYITPPEAAALQAQLRPIMERLSYQAYPS